MNTAIDYDDFIFCMEQDEDLFNIKYLEQVFQHINIDNLDEIIERTKLFSAKQLDDILNANGETLLNLCCQQSSNPLVIQYLLDIGCSMRVKNIYGMDAGIHLLSNKRLNRESAMEFLTIYHKQQDEQNLQKIINNRNNKGFYNEEQ